MNAGSLFFLAMFVPLLLAAVLLVPPYLGMFGAVYLVYSPAEGASPIADKLFDVFYIMDVYNQLIQYWTLHKSTLSFASFTLPVIGLPLICGAMSIWLTVKLSKKFLNVFYGFTAN